MERSLPVVSTLDSTRTCVWVDAGVLNYRLCNHGFACENCSLDAAIRSDPRLVLRGDGVEPMHTRPPWTFPCDRLYAEGHLWAQVIDAAHVRTGIDACAACLLPPVEQVRGLVHLPAVAQGGALCALSFDGGEIVLRSPVAGRVCLWNDRLESDPLLLTTEPYAGGWIAEIALEGNAQLAGLRHAGAAGEEARLTARRFGRQAAFGLLSLPCPEDSWVHPGLPDATRRAIGAAPYLSMVRDVLG